MLEPQTILHFASLLQVSPLVHSEANALVHLPDRLEDHLEQADADVASQDHDCQVAHHVIARHADHIKDEEAASHAQSDQLARILAPLLAPFLEGVQPIR